MAMRIRVRLKNVIPVTLFLLLSLQVDAQHSKKNKVARNPRPPLPKIHFISGNNALKIPFELTGNLILLQARLNDSRPSWFILDTGAEYTVIDSQVAKTLRLKALGRTVGTGGAGTATALIFKGTSLKLPNIEVTNLTVYGLPIDFLSAPLGRKISGVIGNDILRQLVFEVDYASEVINFYEPENYQSLRAGDVIPITFQGKYPFVRARITLDGRRVIEGNFEIDSGATNAIMFNTPFVDRNRLLEGVSKSNQVRTGGVGGSAVAFSGRLKSMRLGSFQLENLVARFSRARRGDDASAKYDGQIGGDILRRFKVVFDYSRRRMMLERNSQFSEPYESDMSGLDLATEGDDFSVVVVNEVEKGSPAEEAGIQGEDTITAIDGHAVKEFNIAQIRRLFMQDGKEYLISLKRGQKELQLKLKLRRLI
jgi:Aspartyl protease/PDZ domain